MHSWDALARDAAGRVKLADKRDTLLTLVNLLKNYDNNLIRYVTAEQLADLTKPGAFQTLPGYILMPLYEQDLADKQAVTLVFSNHGQVHFCEGEYLSDYQFTRTDFYWDYQLPTLKNAPKESMYAESYCFSQDADALQDWDATFYLEKIFDYYGFNGADEMAPLVGFFYVK
eukprot:COSAG01_NODE_1135_length_11553_cov_40.402305_10_plen_172_part_00